MNRYVDITFDCLPLRSIGLFQVPKDASPKYQARCERILRASENFGAFNSYYLYNAQCGFHLTNNEAIGAVVFSFEGTVLTDEMDQRTKTSHLDVQLVRETCDWLTEPIVEWFKETVPKAVSAEFDRYIAAGDLTQTIQRLEKIQAEIDQKGGFVGMYL